MAATEQFSLRWNNYHSNLTAGFHDLLEASEMVDVTLGVDGQYLQAHKLVLSICSPYFKQLFKLNPCKHPIVILKDVTHGNLKDILQFMYLGEVNVLRENLSSFLRTAELLQVKGLTGDDSSETSSRKDDRLDSLADMDDDQELSGYNQSDAEEQQSHYQGPCLSPPPATAATPNLKRNTTTKVSTQHSTKRVKSDCNYNQTIGGVSVKSELQNTNAEDEESDYIMAPKLQCENDDAFELRDINQIALDVNQLGLSSAAPTTAASNTDIMQQQDQGKAKTAATTTSTTAIATATTSTLFHSAMTSTSATPSTKYNNGGHHHHQHHPYKCNQCAKRFSRRDHLRTHEKNIHGEDAGPFACIICSQMYKNSESLRKHIAKFHYHKPTNSGVNAVEHHQSSAANNAIKNESPVAQRSAVKSISNYGDWIDR